MRNTWVVLRREYLERVRTRTFLVLTLLAPAIMTALMILPAKMASMGEKPDHIVIVASTQQFGEMVKRQLLTDALLTDETESEENSSKRKPEDRYTIDIDTNATEAERTSLQEKIDTHAIDGFIWLTDDAIVSRKVTWSGREMASSSEKSWLSDSITQILQQQELSKQGLTAAQSAELLKPLRVEAVRIERGRETKSSGSSRFLEITIMVMLIYVAVLLYGISVMRSVLEEKTSRIMEVLLSSATSTELMTGKILGVGAVGLTQIIVWTVMGGVIALPSMAAQPNFADLQLSPVMMISFVLYFLLGYLLYSTMYATIGAITTTEQEGQQLQFLIVMPLVLSVFMLMPVIRTPDSATVVWLSMVPFFAPIVMYARIVIQTPPLWQIGLSLLLMVGTIAGLVVLCARIYRVGVLIYGKRANLLEIMKWLKYAKA
jgi:ABC-2 type transport system permease protein